MRAKMTQVHPHNAQETPNTLESELRRCGVMLRDDPIASVASDKNEWKMCASPGYWFHFQQWSPLAEMLSAYTKNVAVTPEDKKDLQEALSLYADVLSFDYLESLRTFIDRCEGVAESASIPSGAPTVYTPDIKVVTVRRAVVPYSEVCKIIETALAQAGFSQYAMWRFIYDDTGEELTKENIAIKVQEES